MRNVTNNFPATGTAGGPGSGGCSQPSCGNCEELTARVALLEEERKIIVRERDEAREALREARNDSDEWQSLHAALFAEAETLRQERDEARAELKWMTQLALDMAKELKLKCKDVIHADQVRELTDMINNSNKEAAK